MSVYLLPWNYNLQRGKEGAAIQVPQGPGSNLYVPNRPVVGLDLVCAVWELEPMRFTIEFGFPSGQGLTAKAREGRPLELAQSQTR